MAATSQPIALPSSSNTSDAIMLSGSLTGTNAAASYRQLIGSPISWRGVGSGSFGGRFYPGCSPSQLVGQLDPNDFNFGKLSSSIESDRGSMHNAITAISHNEEFNRNFTCCGIQLSDLHAVVEHFEVCHVVVADPLQQIRPGHYQNALAGAGTGINQPSFYQDPSPQYQVQQSNYPHAFDPDDMELEVESQSQASSGGTTPPDTPITTPLNAYPTNSFNRSQPSSNCASPHLGSPPVSAFDTVVLPSTTGSFPPSVGGRPSALQVAVAEPFNNYSGYSDYSSTMPGTVPSPQAYDDNTPSAISSQPGSPSSCVPPALLYSNDNTPVSTPGSSRLPSPTSSSYFTSSPGAGKASSSKSLASPKGEATVRASTTLSRPASSLLLSKPFKCPKPNCNKSYKQANGLKYHITHGSCNFAPPKDLEQVQALLASKRSQRQAAENGDDDSITEGEMREVEREAERRLRPYACGIGECQRRYKNMNGLRYHYQHSGDHGAIGLGLLASGQHECLQNAHKNSRHANGNSSRAAVQQQPSQQQRAQDAQLQNQQFQQVYGQQQQSPQQQQFMHTPPQQQYGNHMTPSPLGYDMYLSQ